MAPEQEEARGRPPGRTGDACGEAEGQEGQGEWAFLWGATCLTRKGSCGGFCCHGLFVSKKTILYLKKRRQKKIGPYSCSICYDHLRSKNRQSMHSPVDAAHCESPGADDDIWWVHLAISCAHPSQHIDRFGVLSRPLLMIILIPCIIIAQKGPKGKIRSIFFCVHYNVTYSTWHWAPGCN